MNDNCPLSRICEFYSDVCDTGAVICGYKATHIRAVKDITLCCECAYFITEATPHDRQFPNFCERLGIDLMDDHGACSWGKVEPDE